MPEIGEKRYLYHKRSDDRFEVVSEVYNFGLFKTPMWFRNFVADVADEDEAKAIIQKLETKI